MRPDYDQIPETTLETLEAWVATARPLGGFTEALIANDLKEAFARADDENIRAMFHTVAWLYHRAPMAAWGSRDALTRWPRVLRGVTA